LVKDTELLSLEESPLSIWIIFFIPIILPPDFLFINNYKKLIESAFSYAILGCFLYFAELFKRNKDLRGISRVKKVFETRIQPYAFLTL